MSARVEQVILWTNSRDLAMKLLQRIWLTVALAKEVWTSWKWNQCRKIVIAYWQIHRTSSQQSSLNTHWRSCRKEAKQSSCWTWTFWQENHAFSAFIRAECWKNCICFRFALCVQRTAILRLTNHQQSIMLGLYLRKDFAAQRFCIGFETTLKERWNKPENRRKTRL